MHIWIAFSDGQKVIRHNFEKDFEIVAADFEFFPQKNLPKTEIFFYPNEQNRKSVKQGKDGVAAAQL